MAGSRTQRYPKLMVGAVDVADKWAAQDAATAAVALDLSTHSGTSTIHRSINDAGVAVTDLWSASKITSELAAKADTPLTPSLDVPADSLTPAMLDIDNAEVDTYVLSYDLASTSFKWVERVKTDGSNLAANSITEGMLAINTAAGAGVDNFAICWDNGNSRLDYMEMLLQDLSNITAASITEPMLDINNAPTDTYALVWNDGAGKMEWTDISAAVGSDTYKVKWDAGDSEDYLDQKIPELDAWAGKAGQSMVLDAAETGLEWLPRLTRITSNLNLYIDPAGDDVTGDGSIDTPWKSFAKCFSYLADKRTDPGVVVTINVAAGAYAGMAVTTIYRTFACDVVIAGAGMMSTTYACTAGGIVMYGGKLTIDDITIAGAGAGVGITLVDNAVLYTSSLSMGSFATGISITDGARLEAAGTLFINTHSDYCIYVANYGKLDAASLQVGAAANGIYVTNFGQVNVTGSLTASNCTSYGIYAYNCSLISANSYSFSGNVANTNFAITTTSGANTIGGFNSIIIDR